MRLYDRTAAFLNAVEGNDVKSVSALLENSDGINFAVKNAFGLGVVHIAARRDYSCIMRLFLVTTHFDFGEATVRENAQSRSGWTPIHFTTNSKTIKLLLGDIRGRVNVNERTASGRTALYLAVRQNNPERVKLFLADGRIGVNVREHKDGYTSLHYAVCHGFLEVAKLLITERRTDINAASRSQGYTPLHIAVWIGHLQITKLLIADQRTDINAASRSKGLTPLHIAVSKGHLEVAKLLIADQRTDINAAKTDNGLTPLHIALDKHRHEIVEALIGDARLSVNARDKFGKTALTIAGYLGNTRVVSHLLSNHRVDVNVGRLGSGFNALHAAIKQGHTEVVKLLIADERTDINVVWGKACFTPLHMAIDHKRFDILEVLIGDARLEVNAQLSDGSTALISAACRGRTRAVDYLLSDHRVNVNVGIPGIGFIALHAAVHEVHKEVVKLLVAEERADINATRTDNCFTPLRVAIDQNSVVTF